MFCCTLLYVHSSIAIILMRKRELIALLYLSSWCLVMVERLFLAVPRGCQQFVIVLFPDHTHLLFLITFLVWRLRSFALSAGGGGVYRISTCGVENRLLFIWSVLGIFPGVSIGDDSCSFRLFRGVDSLAFPANFRLGVVNAHIPGWDFLLPRGIFFRDFNF